MGVSDYEKVIIIGSGPAGLTAAMYLGRGGVSPLVIGGYSFGGQLMLTGKVENFPGFPDGIVGPDLIKNMRKQAEKFGARIIERDATRVDFKKRPFSVYVEDEEYLADVVIIATGASPRELGLQSERRLKGRGVSYCAVCDGAFFKGMDVVVVGGGDAAIDDALYLTKIVNNITVIHRRDRLRAAAILQKRAFEEPKIKFVWNSIVEEILGEKKVEGVRIRNVKTEETRVIPCSAVFIAIGHRPNTDIFVGQVELDEKGYIKVHDEVKSSIEGVFVAGDVADYKYRQAVTAAGSGCKAALDALKYLEAKGIS
jgi:thioredoxin reductase (NADPH)